MLWDLKTILVKNKQRANLDMEGIPMIKNMFARGYGNGYVILPSKHKYCGVHYNKIPVRIHGGLTFSERVGNLDWKQLKGINKKHWIVGFDTAHHGDNEENWNKENVELEIMKLELQLSVL